MPTLTKDVALNVIGQIQDYQAAVGKLPGVTEAAASRAALKMQAVFVKQALETANAQKKAADDAANAQIEDANRVAKEQEKAAKKAAKEQAKAAKEAAKEAAKAAKDLAKEQEKAAKEAAAVQEAESLKAANAAKVAAGGFSAAFAQAARGVTQNQLISQVETVGSLFIQLGGNVSRLASIFTSAVRPIAIMNAVLGSTGGMLALTAAGALAATAAVAAVAYEVYGLGQKAVDAADELESFGIHVDKEHREQLDAYAIGARNVAIAYDEMDVAAGSGVAESIGAVNTAISDGVMFWQHAKGPIDDVAASIKAITTLFIGYLVGAKNAAIATETVKDVFLLLKGAVNPLGTVFDNLTGSFKSQNRELAKAEESSKSFEQIMGEMQKATDLANDKLEAQVKHTGELASRGKDATTAIKNEIEAEKELAAELTKIGTALDRGAAAYARFQDFARAATKDGLSAEEQLRAAAQSRMDDLDTFYAEGVINAQEYADTRLAIEKSLDRDLEKELVKEQDKFIAQSQKITEETKREAKKRYDYLAQSGFDIANAANDAASAFFDAWATKDQERLSDDAAVVDSYISQNEDLIAQMKQDQDDITEYEKESSHTAAEREIYEATKARLAKEKQDQKYTETSIAGARRRQAEDRKLALQTAKFQRGASVASIALSTFEGVAKAIATWGPPPSPLGIAGIASALAIGAAQTTAVLAQPMPTFFQGTSRIPGAGEVPVTLHGGEAILNQRAAADLGPQIIDALNAGLSPLAMLQGGGGPVMLDGYAVGRVMARQARRSGAFGNAVRSAPIGFVNPYGRY